MWTYFRDDEERDKQNWDKNLSVAHIIKVHPCFVLYPELSHTRRIKNANNRRSGSSGRSKGNSSPNQTDLKLTAEMSHTLEGERCAINLFLFVL